MGLPAATGKGDASPMKLVVAIVQDYDADRLLRAVADAGFGATRLPSMGGFLRTGNTTVLMAVSDDQVGHCLSLVREAGGRRVQRPAVEVVPELTELYPLGVAEVMIGGGVAFVAAVVRHERFEGEECRES